MPLSTIERLPVELLEPIFTYSNCNVALVESSQLISAKLSSKHIYNATCDIHLTQVLDPRADQARFQTVIFASKWMTWSFLQAWILKRYTTIGCLCDQERCFDPQWPPDFEDATRDIYTRSHLPQMAFVRGRVPKKLLQGPWTDDTVQFLRFLLWITGMTIDWKDADARQAAINGRKQAMKEGNREAVELFNHCRRLGKVADMDTVRYAVLECGCDQWIVYDTLLTYVTLGHEKNYYCDELDEWCAKRIQEDDLKGQWLRTRLADLRQSRSSTLRRETSIEMQNDGVDERADLLALQRSRWNRCIVQLGWAYHPTPTSAKVSLHDTRRDEQGDFWSYTRGYHMHVRGEGPSHSFWLDMWIADRLNVEDIQQRRSGYGNVQ